MSHLRLGTLDDKQKPDNNLLAIEVHLQTDMPRQLREWQQIFIDDYVISDAKKSLLVAATGTGKTITTLSAAKKELDNGRISSVVIITDRNILQDQWRHVGREIGLGLSDSLPGCESGAAITFQSLNNYEKLKELIEFTKQRSILIGFLSRICG